MNDFVGGDGDDDRARARREFLAEHGRPDARLTPLPQDASMRRYFRVGDGAVTHRAILMDAPPPEEVETFATVTRHLQRIGARVPAIYAADVARGFLLLEDLGDSTFARLLAAGHGEVELYRRAVDALVAIHRHPAAAAIDLPAFDAGAALAEASLFLDWYLPAQKRPVSATARAEFAAIIKQAHAALPPLPPTLVLRDFHIDNLLLCDGDGDGAFPRHPRSPLSGGGDGDVGDGDAGDGGDGDTGAGGDAGAGAVNGGGGTGTVALLDYQDALIGSPAYDLASLLEDARRDIKPELRRAMLGRYLAQNPDLNADAYHRHMTFWAAQRHLKVAGIFTRLHHRDGKTAYLRHLPRVLNQLRQRLRDPTLTKLRAWLAAQTASG